MGRVAPPDLQVCVSGGASGGPSGRPKVLRGHRLCRATPCGSELLQFMLLISSRVMSLSGILKAESRRRAESGCRALPPPPDPSRLPRPHLQFLKAVAQQHELWVGPRRCLTLVARLQTMLRRVVMGRGGWGLLGASSMWTLLALPR